MKKSLLIIICMAYTTSLLGGVVTPSIFHDTVIETYQMEVPEWVVRWDMARTLSYSQRYDEAIKEYKKALAVHPDPRIEMEIARTLYWKGEQEQALALINKIQHDDIDETMKKFMADLLAAQRRHEEAEKIYLELLHEHPDNVETLLCMARMLSWAGKEHKSLTYYKRILDNNNDNNAVRKEYAFLLLKIGRYQEAAEEFKKIIIAKHKSE
jgi:predicted Zn-dependent protease